MRAIGVGLGSPSYPNLTDPSMQHTLRSTAAVALLTLASAPAQAQNLIDFELAGPCTFNLAQPLTNA